MKIIQIDNLRKGPQLESFRRGVASQKLLRDLGGFDGIAKIKSAYELPPSVIMEFIEGENFEEVLQKKGYDFWTDGINIMINICREISRSHKSKFGVLHRDVRPQNIMLPNYYYGRDASDHGLDQHAIKILNYDMTWHKDASGRVLPTDPRSVGYYAPELLDEPEGLRARDARVDSYGTGMTLYRATSGRAPPVGGSSSTEWHSYLSQIKKSENIWFKSAHNYLSRIIEQSTQRDPNERLFVGDIGARLASLKEAIEAGSKNAPAHFLAENLMFAVCEDDFTANQSGQIFTRDLSGYRTYNIQASRNGDTIKLLFTNSSINSEDWGKIDKLWNTKFSASTEILQSGGWGVDPRSSYSQRVITLSASIAIAKLRSDYTRAEDAMVRAINRVQAS